MSEGTGTHGQRDRYINREIIGMPRMEKYVEKGEKGREKRVRKEEGERVRKEEGIYDSVDLLSFQKNWYNMVCLMLNLQQYIVFDFSKSE
ncbi:MAG: hypothetical protein HF982_11760 [Desulfobacteraceae bacterium]|nr:hypothetical protein [Desulfobacteraceae bacterium]MBC2720239.1 hypothetical protein [Desulfobacteraceae bacterium]